jgi:predicted flap endonuclease-1-like 5' DNA nuclease
MFEIASLIVVNLIIAAIIGFIVGYLIGRPKNAKIDSIENPNVISSYDNKSDTKAKPAINPVFRKNAQVDYKPLVLSSPRLVGKDNLQKIKGIDSTIENNLNNLGIYHFDQISKWSNKNCDWIEEFLHSPSCAKNNQWIDQAKILQSGRETIYSQKIENGEEQAD